MLPKQSPNDIRQRTDLVVERVLQWSRYEVASGNSAHIFFSMGNLRRNGVRATICEDDVAVRISLCEGILPEAQAEYAALGENTPLLLTTRSPIETRLVVQR